ncbi:MAG TPA: hypothetical protein VGU01_11985 [Sphingomicrobium sp.]|nr:hypothetical protein [Sphingomicrobium sp.]
MAKRATAKGSEKDSGSKGGRPKGTSLARVPSDGRSGKSNSFNPGEAVIKLLQSPLVAELVAVAATAALAALAEHGFTSGEATRGKRAGKAVKEAGKAAAAAVGRRLGTEMEEIRKAATESTVGARA